MAVFLFLLQLMASSFVPAAAGWQCIGGHNSCSAMAWSQIESAVVVGAAARIKGKGAVVTERERVVIIGKDRVRGTIEAPDRGAIADETQVLIRLENGRRVIVPAELLKRQDDGTYYLPLSLADLERQYGARVEDGERRVVPVVEEELDVQKRTVETGRVRITKVAHEREEVVDEPLLREEVNIERVPVNRVVEGPVQVRREGNTLIVPLLEEVLVVEKRLMLKEELHITKRRFETREPRAVTLRTEEANIERVDARER